MDKSGNKPTSDLAQRLIKPAVIALTALGLVVAFVYLALYGWSLVSRAEEAALKGLGVGIWLLVAVGLWATWAIVRNGLELQRISAAASAAGIELDTSALPRRPSGRIEREAADHLFDLVSEEYQAAPEDWKATYRLARAYDYAGDRIRARETMRQAIALREGEATP